MRRIPRIPARPSRPRPARNDAVAGSRVEVSEGTRRPHDLEHHLLGLGQRVVHFQSPHHFAELLLVDVAAFIFVELLEEVDDLLELEGREVVDVLIRAPA